MEKLKELLKLAVGDEEVRLYKQSKPDDFVVPDDWEIAIGDTKFLLKDFLQWWGSIVCNEAIKHERKLIANQLIELSKNNIGSRYNGNERESLIWEACAKSFLVDMAFHISNPKKIP